MQRERRHPDLDRPQRRSHEEHRGEQRAQLRDRQGRPARAEADRAAGRFSPAARRANSHVPTMPQAALSSSAADGEATATTSATTNGPEIQISSWMTDSSE